MYVNSLCLHVDINDFTNERSRIGSNCKILTMRKKIESLGQVAVVETMKERQKSWKEKLEGMDGDRLVKQVYEGDVEGRRPRGRPRKRWVDDFK